MVRGCAVSVLAQIWSSHAFLAPPSKHHRIQQTTTLSLVKPTKSKSIVSSYETFGDAALSEQTFAELYSPDLLPEWLSEKCRECGWTYPTLVQQRALDEIYKGKDVVIQAQTGSGKTLAYLLPLFSKIDASRAAIQALVVVPTRELGLQVARVAKRLAAGTSGKDKVMVMSILQGSQHKRQRAWAWAEPPQVVIGTPEELTNMVRYGGIRYNAVQYVVVDEVDACLLNNAGSMSTNLSGSGPLHELLSRHLSPTFEIADKLDDLPQLQQTEGRPRPVSQNRQTIFCSATIPQHRHFLKQCLQNQWTVQEPSHVCASPGELLPPTLEHVYMVCTAQEKKLAALRRLLKKISNLDKALIFCEPNRPMEEMAQVIAKDVENGIYWQEGYGPTEEGSADAIVTVLRYEDSLSKRASAMLGFLGSDGGNIEGRRFHQDDNKETPSKVRILFSTDLAARGLDVTDISHVIHFDLPHESDTYVHRAGRAGRLGRKGSVMSLVTQDQEFVLQRLANKLSLDLKCIARQQKRK
jgi:superfamily II DNA/RNA helicase